MEKEKRAIRVKDLMTRSVISISVEETAEKMRDNKIRRLVVKNKLDVVGDNIN